MTELISLIVATYNRDTALDAVLRACGRQTDGNFEVVVADDGSGPATRRVIDACASALPFRCGTSGTRTGDFAWPKSATAPSCRAPAAIVCFSTATAFRRPDFIAAHRRLAEPGWFVAGNRALMSPALSARVKATS